MVRSYDIRWAFTWLFVIFVNVYCYKPVVIIHGLFDKPENLEYLASYISKKHSRTNVTVINLYDGLKSLSPLWEQIHEFGNSVSKIMKENPDGIHMIGYSQGGLIARGIISTLDNHNVNTFISLSSPQMGQYGDTDIIKVWFRDLIKKYAYKFFYTNEGQLISIGNFWNDPHHRDIFLNKSIFLPYFMRLKKLILIGGPDDGVICPWQSSQFGFYTKNEDILPMEKQWVYKIDAFGLRTLSERNAMKILTMAGIDHYQWHKNQTIFDNFILPYLD
ncbi:lysosomal thioesterase PPT2-A-like [Centruroides sculpturatus]|uniref:lysosomal thioesterase PPT2-A-like n=1 Tax=Centruroides sculpturatus TaxID=218467 RepID=UPI000C6D9715|nr:lysosomal thioesterase PPT2-A-like [Centruroides sculpturatus]